MLQLHLEQAVGRGIKGVLKPIYLIPNDILPVEFIRKSVGHPVASAKRGGKCSLPIKLYVKELLILFTKMHSNNTAEDFC